MLDIPELVTATLSIAIVIGAITLSQRYGYRRGTEEAVGQIREAFQARITELHKQKNTNP